MATHNKRVITLLLAVITIALMFPHVCTNALAQTDTSFTPSNKFSIPSLNGTISFSLNGSCSSAILVNDSWVFSNLRLNNTQPPGNLTVSVTNSAITIFSFGSVDYFGARAYIVRISQLRYSAEGAGTQTVNLGLDLSQPTHPSEWSISVPGRSGFLSEGSNWKLLPDNSVVVFGLTGNVSVTHFSNTIPNNSNLPFYQQHSVIIITAIILGIVVAIAVVIRVKVGS
jgi:hypothetical protein